MYAQLLEKKVYEKDRMFHGLTLSLFHHDEFKCSNQDHAQNHNGKADQKRKRGGQSEIQHQENQKKSCQETNVVSGKKTRLAGEFAGSKEGTP